MTNTPTPEAIDTFIPLKASEDSAPPAPVGVEAVAIPLDAFEFLMGRGPIEGYHFGEAHPTRRGAFWWRSAIRESIAVMPQSEIIQHKMAEIARLEAEIARLAKRLDQAADNLEAGASLYGCPGLTAAAVITRLALKGPHDD
jgi:hypothetical protein